MDHRSACTICLEEISNFSSHKEAVRLAECNDTFCTNCLGQFLSLKLTEQIFPITCPQHGCQHVVEDHIAEKILDVKEMDKWWLKSAEATITNKVSFDLMVRKNCCSRQLLRRYSFA